MAKNQKENHKKLCKQLAEIFPARLTLKSRNCNGYYQSQLCDCLLRAPSSRSGISFNCSLANTQNFSGRQFLFPYLQLLLLFFFVLVRKRELGPLFSSRTSGKKQSQSSCSPPKNKHKYQPHFFAHFPRCQGSFVSLVKLEFLIKISVGCWTRLT